VAEDFKRKLAIFVTIIGVAAILVVTVTIAYWLVTKGGG